MAQFFERISKIFGILDQEYNIRKRFSNDNAKKDVYLWAEMKPEDQNIPDYFFLLNVCYGPWDLARQKSVWVKAYSIFKKVHGGDLRNVPNDESLGLPLPWQIDHINKVAEYLKSQGLSFREFLDSQEGKSGLEIRDEFGQILETGSLKIVSTFIRDFMGLAVFPIDRRVKEMLSFLGLPRSEDMIVDLCEVQKVNSNTLNRMLFAYHSDRCDNYACKDCIINEHCYCWYLKYYD